MAKPWGNGNPVIISDNDKDLLVREIVAAVTAKSSAEFLEQFKQFTLTKAQLDEALREIARKNEVIAQHEATIAQLHHYNQALMTRPPIQPYAGPTSVVTQP